MTPSRYAEVAALGALVLSCQAVFAASPAPAFETAYRAWDLVTGLARRHGDAAISGECGKTFRPFVSPGLRMQTRQEQDASATACVQAARAACANPKFGGLAETARKCEEFR